jgi:DNA-binding winged helix-turn-helix (wHTH) protein/TolB-like protein
VGEQFRFGPFEFDAGSGELRRRDAARPVHRLPPQPARLLALLAERQGAVVTREEIRERIWPDTNVDFDASLHFCIRQVRTALGDSASQPSYVENVPRRGYRLRPEASPVRVGVDAGEPVARRGRRTAWLLSVPVVLATLATAYFVVGRQAAATSPVRIGIMPFQPPAGMPGAGGWRPIVEWILEDLSVVAGSSAGLVGPTTTAAYDASEAGLRRLADDYDLHYIVNGRFLEAERGPRMLAELIRVSDGAHVWVRSYEDLSEGRRIGLDISRNVARVLELESPDVNDGRPATPARSAGYLASKSSYLIAMCWWKAVANGVPRSRPRRAPPFPATDLSAIEG